MNRLTTEERARVVASLVEGNSIRATARMTGIAKNTAVKLLADLAHVALTQECANSAFVNHVPAWHGKSVRSILPKVHAGRLSLEDIAASL